jgi:hypothetical protein
MAKRGAQTKKANHQAAAAEGLANCARGKTSKYRGTLRKEFIYCDRVLAPALK